MSEPVSSLVESLLQGAVNRVLRLDADTLRRLAELDGKTIRLDLGEGASILTLFIQPSADGLRIARHSDRSPDVTLKGSVPVFARLARTGIAPGELQISGDVELGARFKRILEDIDPDWEEPLARVFGDVAGHQIGRAVRAAVRWGAGAARTLAQDTAEYLQEEARVLAPRLRVEAFSAAVDELRTSTERLQKRIELLAGRAR